MAPPPKRRKLGTAPATEILFDNDARHEYLTGFHKRKLQRAKHAQEIAEKKAKEEKREQRRKLREERHAEFQKAIEESRKRLLEMNGSSSDSQGGGDSEEDNSEEWEGFTELPAVDYEAEYIDENKYTTVTVEDMDLSKEGIYQATEINDSREMDGREPRHMSSVDRVDDNQPSKKNLDHAKKKKKKFRYESPAERKATRMKERTGNRKQAKARRAA
ncbi:hypothetical protein PRK78_005503 [Emydomyces testavorans]|uniref:Ribosomal RNA-processing protein 17 n=1 Tax=Emydomyces testavorans TaxID=2070801 RepID=A0AAF0DM89_9EURO|nr:hypothetical protein PRK78_005503 [Emydomyces testavorans]